MKSKSKTPSFVLELPLKTTLAQESTILVRLEAGRQLYNACLGEALKRLDLVRQSKKYQEIILLPKGKERTDRFNGFKRLNLEYEFTEYALHSHASKIRDSWIWEYINQPYSAKNSYKSIQRSPEKSFWNSKEHQVQRQKPVRYP